MTKDNLASPQVTDEQIAFANITKPRVIAELERVADVYGLDIRDKRESDVVEEAVWLVWRALSAPPAVETRTCKCNLRTKLVGDGCDVCNPEYAADHADDSEASPQEAKPVASDVQQHIAIVRETIDRLRAGLAFTGPLFDCAQAGMKALNELGDMLAAAPQEQAPADKDAVLEWALNHAESCIEDGEQNLAGSSINAAAHQESREYWKDEREKLNAARTVLQSQPQQVTK